MLTPRRSHRHTLQTGLLLLLFLALGGGSLRSAQSSPLPAGSAILTSVHGSVTVRDASGHTSQAELHASFNPAEIEWTTGNEGALFVVFSNSTAVGLDANTKLGCVDYGQLPFDASKIEPLREPSHSRLMLRLHRGRLAISGKQRSPLSTLSLRIPFGDIRLRRGDALVDVDDRGVTVISLEGNLTVSLDGIEEPIYVSASEQIRLTAQSVRTGQAAERTKAAVITAEWARLLAAAQNARDRVHFLANAGTGRAADPVLIIPADAIDRPSPRPYRFRD
jgi:hypothetical protein